MTLAGIRSREGADLAFDADDEGNEAAAFTSSRNDLLSARYLVALGSRVTSHTILALTTNRELIEFDGRFRNEARRSNVADDLAFGFSEVIFASELEVRDLALRQEITVELSAGHRLGFGAELHDLTSTIRFRTDGDRNEQEANGSSVQGGVGLPERLVSSLDGARGALWIEDEIRIGERLSVVPGVRLDFATTNRRTTLSPRVAARLLVDPRTTLRLAGGLYTQSPGYEKLLQSDYFIDLSNAAALGIRHEKAWHAIVGVGRELGGGFRVDLEGYWKRFTDLIVGRLESAEELAARRARYAFPSELAGAIPDEPFITSNAGNDGRGRAWGIDLYLVKPARAGGRLHGWLGYTLGWARQEAYGQIYPFDYDRRHALSLVAGYRLSSRWDAGLTARWSSGFPRTAPTGLRVAAVEDPLHDGDGPAQLVPARDPFGNLVYTIDYGGVANLNRDRLPAYARVDLRLDYRPGGVGGRWEIYVEVLNVLGRDNAGALEPWLRFNPDGAVPILEERPERALPRLPSFGVRFRF